jgi:hypothetical protein
LTALTRSYWKAHLARCCYLVVSVEMRAILPAYLCTLLAPPLLHSQSLYRSRRSAYKKYKLHHIILQKIEVSIICSKTPAENTLCYVVSCDAKSLTCTLIVLCLSDFARRLFFLMCVVILNDKLLRRCSSQCWLKSPTTVEPLNTDTLINGHLQ